MTEPFIISRIYDLPRELMWQLWTEASHMGNWWSPKGFKPKSGKMDFRVGGTYHYCLTAPDGSDMWGKMVYKEIKKPEKIVWVNSFSNEKGDITTHPMSPTWPREMHSTLTLEEEAGKTKVTITWLP